MQTLGFATQLTPFPVDVGYVQVNTEHRNVLGRLDLTTIDEELDQVKQNGRLLVPGRQQDDQHLEGAKQLNEGQDVIHINTKSILVDRFGVESTTNQHGRKEKAVEIHFTSRWIRIQNSLSFWIINFSLNFLS